MKPFFIALFISVFALKANAQQVRFVYLQTENNQPFYVKVNNNVMSSSQGGYVIIPNLMDGPYQLVVGFPKNEFPEEKFNITIDNKNEGFLVKNFGEKGWSLFNLQSLALIDKSSETATAAAATTSTTTIQSNPFSDMLASVVKDSSILRKEEPVKTEPTVPSVQQDSAVPNPSSAVPNVAPVVSDSSSQISNGSVASGIRKVLSVKEEEGVEMIYLDSNESKTDTIRIFIPVSKKEEKKVDNLLTEKNSAVTTVVSDSSKGEIPPAIDSSRLTITPTIVSSSSDSVKFIYRQPVPENEIQKENKIPVSQDSAVEIKQNSDTAKAADINNAKKPPVIINTESDSEKVVDKVEIKQIKPAKDNEIIVLPKAATSSASNSDCKAFATDSDFLKLRKKMAGETSDEAMISAAKKLFRSKCFTTEQIKNLSYLFLTDEGKYMFFDAAYAYTSDSDQYSSLASQLTDEYYVNRFNAMIHK